MSKVFSRALLPLMVAASSSVMAGQFYAGVGIAGFIGSGEEEYTSGRYSVTYDYEYSQQSIGLGYQFDNDNRLEVSLATIDVEYDNDFYDDESYSGLDVDYSFVWRYEAVRPYLLIGFGLYTYDDSGEYYADGEDLSGVAFNFGAGVIWQFHEHLDVDLGYGFKSIGWQDAEDGHHIYETQSTQSGFDLAAHILF
ncbi:MULTISPECIES: outer membrane beta-barrel protein [unclassified Oceanobacter]|uniref:outer membrane beta-barrel protein n=1 Tax=unclassified Oceanobacter TaxID=2620260 RepID=UPI002732D919|nr:MULTISPECIES: outer membrane beta-barrel protein [unclassified Oceanobacter]MDP2607776.1 outer membrane beta-barrel protein [Oceanobacter sp. 1_MG-2023]MDP2611040.1 outer membrane beta-barrel protein [Oceanobacter sp. 2_MG-2023]